MELKLTTLYSEIIGNNYSMELYEELLFIEGIKPSMIVDLEKTTFKNKLKNYPYIQISDRYVHFFQTEKMKVDFVSEYDVSKEDEWQWYDEKFYSKIYKKRILARGKYLGYPQSASLNHSIKKSERKSTSWFIEYSGINFGTSEELLNENLTWLRATYRIPENLKIETIMYNLEGDKIRLPDISKGKIKKYNLDRYDNVQLY